MTLNTNPWMPLAFAALAPLALACTSKAEDGRAPQRLSQASQAEPSPAVSTEKMEKGPAPLPTEPFADGAHAFAAVKDALLESYYAAGLTEDDLYRAAAQGMLERVDPKMRRWNKLLGPAELAAIRSDLKGEIVGVGVNIHYDDETGYSRVECTLPGSPAERAGLEVGDVIVAVDGKLFRGLEVQDILRAIRGKAGEPVTLSVLRGDKMTSMTIKREVVAYAPVKTLDLPDGVGYVAVHSFTAKTPASLRAAFEHFAKARALVLDLRENQGGGFDDAVASAELAGPAGATIARIRRRTSEETFTSKGSPVAPDVPIAILVGHGTASGAELVTEALKENRHAYVVGARTFGKWSVQVIDTLPNGYAFKYTSALFESPSGKTFDGVGIEPDVEVDMDQKQLEKLEGVKDAEKRLAADPQLRSAVALLRARL